MADWLSGAGVEVADGYADAMLLGKTVVAATALDAPRKFLRFI
jgi:hypothetical protein